MSQSKVAGKEASMATTLMRAWNILHPLPGGTWLFSKLLGWFVPYTGTINAKVVALEPGYARVELRDHRRVRNHLRSIHAIALTNLGEVTSAIAMFAVLPVGFRGIVTTLSIDFLKKARGRLIAESHCDLPQITGLMEHLVHAEIKNQAGDTVAKVHVTWQLDKT